MKTLIALRRILEGGVNLYTSQVACFLIADSSMSRDKNKVQCHLIFFILPVYLQDYRISPANSSLRKPQLFTTQPLMLHLFSLNNVVQGHVKWSGVKTCCLESGRSSFALPFPASPQVRRKDSIQVKKAQRQMAPSKCTHL